MDENLDLAETIPPDTPEEPPHVPPPEIPAEIGRYRVILLLGHGSFGRVYLAHDVDIDRQIAIKVPNLERISRPGDAEAFLAEARLVARLDHPHIVPVYDVGRTADGLCYIVSKFIEGSDLAAVTREGRVEHARAAELAATVAEALHHAHTRGLVHRDVKPANILIDPAGKPYVADFGLALKDEDFGRGATFAGTPAYMSPEQARSEGHLVDGRSDIFSLGVVLYELLTGRRPFRGETRAEVLEQINRAQVRPPRQVDDTIPRELERICLKAMSRRAIERYNTARDMAEDLRLFVQSAGPIVSPTSLQSNASVAPGSRAESGDLAGGSRESESDQRAVRIVPKGLRSFDEHDADFFLKLVPGPRDRDGLPESIRFWKTRIEEIDPAKTFRVGLIYGPSGCGKSSLLKAGLLPRLGKQVVPVAVEATADDTEGRLLRGIRKACPDLPQELALVGSLMALRQWRLLRAGQKLLLVIDQLEQWLHSRRGEENTELVAALRHCDGEHLQSMVLVRDDFWLAVSRFMAELEIELAQGQNFAVVDLFDRRHTRKVLRAFGQSYGTLPGDADGLTRDRDVFLDQAVVALAEDNKVIPVRLALFAEMLKGKPWTPAIFRDVGGMEGLGVTFLEESFASAHANPAHRLHQEAARRVLRMLLPESSTDIKGAMRSREELLDASGYAQRLRDFDGLIHILDNELRLITPTEPAGLPSSTVAPGPRAQATRYYQLTHDYLVPSLRDWLTRKQRETRRGRAEIRLAERTALWNTKPENRHLPSAWEWANIRLLTRRKHWTDPQRRMMGKAGRVHGVRGFLVLAALAAATLTGLVIRNRVNEDKQATRAEGLVRGLLNADTGQVPALVTGMRNYRRWVDPLLRDALGKVPEGSRERLHASLALLGVDRDRVDYVEKRLLAASPLELPVIWEIMSGQGHARLDRLWAKLEDSQANPEERFRAACALANSSGAQAGKRWESVSPFVAGRFLTAVINNPADYAPLLKTLRPIRKHLLASLAGVFSNSGRSESERNFATTILADYAADDPNVLAELIMAADPNAYLALFPLAEREARTTVPIFEAEIAKQATYSWDDPPLDPSWTRPDPTLVSRIESAQGMVADRFAICQTMPMDEFRRVAEGLRKSGYRPRRFRPFADGPTVNVAAVWARDGRAWRMGAGLTSEEVRAQDMKNRSEKLVPVDVSGYAAAGTDGGRSDRYAVVWAAKSSDDDAELYVGAAGDEHSSVEAQLSARKLIPRTVHAFRGAAGRTRYCGVWGRSAESGPPSQTRPMQSEASLKRELGVESDQRPIDVAITAVEPPRTSREDAKSALDSSERSLKVKPDDLNARWARAAALIRLGEDGKALDDLGFLIDKAPQFARARHYRAMVHARLGQKRAALEDLAKYQRGDATESSKLYLAVVVAAELKEGLDRAFEGLESALERAPGDARLHYDAACAYAAASKALARRDRIKSERQAERALRLLESAITSGYSDYDHIEEDADLDPVRDRPAFAELMRAGHSDRRYLSVWSSDLRFEVTTTHGLEPAAHLSRCRDLEAQGRRPVAISIVRISPDGAPVTASVWRRPAISEQAKDELAHRQARAAVALVRLGHGEQVWPRLRYSLDPRLRSFIVNWLSPLGADPKVIADELDRRDFPATRHPSPATPKMDTILFHPETSIRRALILAVGAYGINGLAPGDRAPLIAKLFDLYEHDPDSGTHGAAEWTLRQWEQAEKLKEISGRLKGKETGSRRWFVNSQGQTFAVIDGPVEFRMGSPPAEPERDEFETPHRQVIAHRFAIADKEVTVEQYQRFARENPQFGFAQSYLDKFSPDPSGPMINVSWFGAAAYCNWLSKQEQLPEDQWCYLRNERGEYDAGMRIPADVLKRKGYRLPAEAEWEYACRAGTVTSRYHGLSIGLLEGYAWYVGNSKEHAWPGGTLRPNDLGLFDMLGNVYEWCQDRFQNVSAGGIESTYDDILDIRSPCLLRGGTFGSHPAFVRSAYRGRYAPLNRDTHVGFRLARTYD
jgi:serine/threonine protein kinase/formylglycine-generating enzyme required for sulfatase activity